MGLGGPQCSRHIRLEPLLAPTLCPGSAMPRAQSHCTVSQAPRPLAVPGAPSYQRPLGQEGDSGAGALRGKPRRLSEGEMPSAVGFQELGAREQGWAGAGGGGGAKPLHVCSESLCLPLYPGHCIHCDAMSDQNISDWHVPLLGYQVQRSQATLKRKPGHILWSGHPPPWGSGPWHPVSVEGRAVTPPCLHWGQGCATPPTSMGVRVTRRRVGY